METVGRADTDVGPNQGRSSENRTVKVRFPDRLTRIRLESVDHPILSSEENRISVQCGRIFPCRVLAIETTRKMPAYFACGKLKTEQVIALGHCVEAIVLSHNIGCDAEILKVSRADEILPADCPGRTIEGVDVALAAGVGANHDQIVRNKRIVMEAVLIAILLDVVAPTDLASIFVESVEIPRARADVK